ncbi:MAG: S8 family serine peptidase [Desulfobaccales bacterium]
MTPFDLVNLPPLIALTSGRPEVMIGLIDGPVALDHPDLPRENLKEVSGPHQSKCAENGSAACLHGTYIAGILCGKRDSIVPGICPNCTVLVRPIFAEAAEGMDQMPSATPEELAGAILNCIESGARVLNLSVALSHPSGRGERRLEEVLDYAAKRGVIIVAAAGNQGTLGSSAITRHPWAIPVIAYDSQGRPQSFSNLGKSIGTRGLGAPGDNVTSLGVGGQLMSLSGTSVAVPFVTGAIGLLWSEFPAASAAQVKLAISQPQGQRRPTLVPPLMNARAAYGVLKQAYPG